MIQHFEKFNADAIEFTEDQWSRGTPEADGTVTYTATADGSGGSAHVEHLS